MIERFPTVPNSSPDRFRTVPRFPPIGDRELFVRNAGTVPVLCRRKTRLDFCKELTS